MWLWIKIFLDNILENKNGRTDFSVAENWFILLFLGRNNKEIRKFSLTLNVDWESSIHIKIRVWLFSWLCATEEYNSIGVRMFSTETHFLFFVFPFVLFFNESKVWMYQIYYFGRTEIQFWKLKKGTNRKSTKWPEVWGNSKTDGKHAGKHAAEKILELFFFSW